MKIKSYKPETITINPELRARKGPPDPEKVQRIAESIASYGQLQPGIVREEKDGNILVAGEHRLEAIKSLNTLLGENEKPYEFQAVVIKAGDEKALIDAIVENEYRVASDIFDRSVAMGRLVAMGKSNTEIARIFGVSDATVTQTLKAGKLPAKIIKSVRAGDLTEEAALMLADIEDKATQQEVLELALKYRADMDAFDERMARKRQEEADAAAEQEGEDEEEEAEPGAGGTATAKKKAKKPAKKVAKKGRKAPKGKATKEDVQRAKKDKGLTSAPAPVSRKAFIVALEALGSDKENPVPKSARDLMGRIEGYLDGEYTITQLRNAFTKFCVAD